jgi:hypothetical protein
MTTARRFPVLTRRSFATRIAGPCIGRGASRPEGKPMKKTSYSIATALGLTASINIAVAAPVTASVLAPTPSLAAQ